MSPAEVAIVALTAVAVVGFGGWAYAYRRNHRLLGAVGGPAWDQSPEGIGELDGRAGIPNDLTGVPFPTPAMDKFYEAGERARADVEGSHVENIRILCVREEVLVTRGDELEARIESTHNPAEKAELRRELGLVRENLAARRAAAKSAVEDRAARLDALDADTKSQADRYWGANLRVRHPASDHLQDLDLHTLIPPAPSEWRASRARGMGWGQEADAARAGQTVVRSGPVPKLVAPADKEA